MKKGVCPLPYRTSPSALGYEDEACGWLEGRARKEYAHTGCENIHAEWSCQRYCKKQSLVQNDTNNRLVTGEKELLEK
jgi:hypothetical protein